MAKRILIVEDDAEIAASLRELLVEEGFDVSSAENGRIALDVLRTSAAFPDLILLDFMMPDMDGRQFHGELSRESRWAEIPILLMTAGGDITKKAQDLGARAYLQKPFSDLDTFLEVVQRCLSQQII